MGVRKWDVRKRRSKNDLDGQKKGKQIRNKGRGIQLIHTSIRIKSFGEQRVGLSHIALLSTN